MAKRRETSSTGLTAAAQVISLSNRQVMTAWRKRRENWHDAAWLYLDEIPQLNFATSFMANLLSKSRLFVATLPSPDESPVPTDNPSAIAALERLESGSGIAEMLRIMAACLQIPGEVYLVGYQHEGPENEQWGAFSADTVRPNNSGEVRIPNLLSRGTAQDLVLNEDDFLMRIWQRHPRWPMNSTSAVRSVLGACEELLLFGKAARAMSKSRMNAGVWVIANEIDFGEPDDPQSPDNGKTIRGIMESIIAPIADEEAASAIAPFVLRAPVELMEKGFKHLTFAREMDAELSARADVARSDLFQGLDLPPEVIKGLGDASHWNAWQASEATVRDHTEPRLLMICEAITTGYLQPLLAEAGIANPESYFIWYDVSKLSQRPDRAADAQVAHAAMAVSDATLRDALGFDDSDIPSPEELLRRVLEKRALLDPTLQDVLDKLSPPSGPVVISAPATGPPALSAAAGPKYAHLGKRLASIDQALRQKLHTAAEMVLERALERAGARLRNKTKGAMRARLRQVPNHEVATVLTHEEIAQLGYDEDLLLADAFDELGSTFDRSTHAAAIQTVRTLTQEFDLTDDEAEALTQQFDRERSRARDWFGAAFLALAAARLYNPRPAPDPEGEVAADSRVPFGLIRSAVSLAGGAEALDPSGGIASGTLSVGVLAENGLDVGGYVWVYGPYPRTRPFEEHESLDGVEFSTFEDEVLANPNSFPEQPFYEPGDHAFCLCSTELQVTEAGQEAA